MRNPGKSRGKEETETGEMNQARASQQKQLASDKYNEGAREVKKVLRKDKRSHYNNLANEAEVAADKGDLKALYAAIRLFSGRWGNPHRPVRDKTGQLLTFVHDQLAR